MIIIIMSHKNLCSIILYAILTHFQSAWSFPDFNFVSNLNFHAKNSNFFLLNKMPQNVAKCRKMLQNAKKCRRMPQNSAKWHKILQTAANCRKILQNGTKYRKMPQNVAYPCLEYRRWNLKYELDNLRSLPLTKKQELWGMETIDCESSLGLLLPLLKLRLRSPFVAERIFRMSSFMTWNQVSQM